MRKRKYFDLENLSENENINEEANDNFGGRNLVNLIFKKNQSLKLLN